MDTIKVDTHEIPIVYVVCQYIKQFNDKTQEYDEFQKLLWSFASEKEAQDFKKGVEAKMPPKTTRLSYEVFIIPTPFGCHATKTS